MGCLTTAVGLLQSEEDDEWVPLKYRKVKEYRAADRHHDKKADEADDGYDYDPDDHRLAESEYDKSSEIGSVSDTCVEDLDCAEDKTLFGTEESDYDSDLSEEDPAPPTPRKRAHRLALLGGTDTAAADSTATLSAHLPPSSRDSRPLSPHKLLDKRVAQQSATQRCNVKY